MRYQATLTIATNTAATDPTSTRLRLTVGKVSRATVSFPAGCAGLVGARVMRGGSQLWPVVVGEWFVTDNFNVDIEEGYYLYDEPLDLVFEAYNTDRTYPHTLTLQVDLIEPHADPIQQMREIARRITRAAPVSTGAFPAEAQQALFDIRDLLWIIHTNDLPTIYNAIAQLRR